MKPILVPSNPLLDVRMSELRARETDREEFARLLHVIGIILAVETCKFLETETVRVLTPMEPFEGKRWVRPVVLVPILRAGLGLLAPFHDVFPQAPVGHMGVMRNEETLQPTVYYQKLPSNLDRADVLVLDPMLATGNSSSAVLDRLKKHGAKRLILISCLSAPEGVEVIQKQHPDVQIITASLDRQLNERGYILPGLGDAGDRLFGTN